MVDSQTKLKLIQAAQTGQLDILRRHLPDWTNTPIDTPSEDNAEWDFLDDLQPNPAPTALLDDRGYNLLDLAFESVRQRLANGEDAAHMAPAVLELIAVKGIRPSKKTLQALLPPDEFAALGRVQTKVHIFRRTIGIFARAAFQFRAFDPAGGELLNQKMATWGLYGIAYILNHDPAPTPHHMTPRDNQFHPAFFHLGESTSNSCSGGLNAFVKRMLNDEVMALDLIKDGHAWRMLHEINQCSDFEACVLKVLGDRLPNGPTSAWIPQHPPGTILLVEDNDEQRLKTASDLAREGFQVLTASDGIAAETMFKHHQSSIDLVLSDLEMPQRDGLQLLQILRQIDPRIPLILNTVPPQLHHQDLIGAVNALGNAFLIPKFDEKQRQNVLRASRVWGAEP